MLLGMIRNATSELTEDEKSIFAMVHAVSQRKMTHLRAEHEIDLDIHEFSKRRGITKKEAFKRLVKAVEILFDRSFSFTELTENNHEAVCMTRWIGQYAHSIDVNLENPTITIHASPFLIEHLDHISQYLESFIVKDVN